MRFAAAIAAAVVCSSVCAATPTATSDPTIEPERIDMSRPPAPPTDVNVLNFPDVQTVGGTVNVGNLPLDADGAVRVSGATAREPVLMELVPGGVTVESMTTYLSPVIDVAGYSKIGIQSSGNWNVPSPTWRWEGTPADDFGAVNNMGEAHSANGDCGSPRNGERYICLVSGVQIRFQLWNNAAMPVRVESIRVYLIP